MSRKATCDFCDFKFFMGHSHHTSGSSCLCLHCGSMYFCVSKSRFGPEAGESMPICRREYRRNRRRLSYIYAPTGAELTAVDSSTLGDASYGELGPSLPFAGLNCPDCGHPALVGAIEPHSVCPKCRAGKIAIHPVEIQA